MNKLFIPYQMTCPRPTLSDSKRPRKKIRPLPRNNLPTPTPSPTFTEFALPSDIITFTRDEKIGNQETIRRWKKVAEGYKKEAERWKIRALDLAHSQERGIEALEDCWTNLRTTEGDGYSNSQFAQPKQSGKAGDGTWAYYVTSSKRCQMQQKVDDLGRQVKELERTVERLRLESVSRFDPYFGSIGGDVDDDDRLPTLVSCINRHDIHTDGWVECTGFIDQLFPGLAITSHTVKDLDLVEGDVDVDDGIPPTPTSLFSDIFPDLDPVTISDSNSGPPSTLSLLSSDTRTSGTLFTDTHDPTDNTEIVHINQDLAPGFDSGLTSAPQPLASGPTEPPLLDTPNPVGDDDILSTSESRPESRIDTFDSETRQGSSRSNRHQLQELGDWARNVLFVLEMEGDGVGEEIEHLEWTWELIKQFQSCIDTQKSIN
jgi:hypothetical protein